MRTSPVEVGGVDAKFMLVLVNAMVEGDSVTWNFESSDSRATILESSSLDRGVVSFTIMVDGSGASGVVESMLGVDKHSFVESRYLLHFIVFCR